jgi:putative lipoprotein
VPKVFGEVVLPADLPPGTPLSTVVVEVRDVSLADAPAPVVASTVIDDAPLEPGGRIPFELDIPEPEPGHDLGLRVHVDRTGSGTTTKGDLLNTVAVHVAGPLARPGSSPVVVPVTQI